MTLSFNFRCFPRRAAREPSRAALLLCLLLGLAPQLGAQTGGATYAFGTLAGGNGAGSANATGSSAQFALPAGIAVDASGNLYVADTGNSTIRKIGAGGVVTTLAGAAGVKGYLDGVGTAARFASPAAIAVDGNSTLYVADSSNQTIRVISTSGAVSTLAGSAAMAGSTDGLGTAARFSGPSGLAVDKTGNLYVADTNNHTIRKISPAGLVTTLAGAPGVVGTSDGTGSAALFNQPKGIALDLAGNLYVTDYYYNSVRKITPAGVVTTVIYLPVYNTYYGTNPIGVGYSPWGIAVDGGGNIYLSATGVDWIVVVAASGTLTKLAGYDASGMGASGTLSGTASNAGSTDGVGGNARFNGPAGLAVDANGTIYVADQMNNTIRRITPGALVTTLVGVAPGPTGTDGVGAAASFSFPQGIAVDASGTTYVADTNAGTIRKITPAAAVTTLASGFRLPNAVAVDNSGNVYVADTGDDTIRKVTAAGVVSTVAGSTLVTGAADGAASTARFNGPKGIAVDASGNLYVADTGNATIREISPAGTVTTLAGLTGLQAEVDGMGSSARFFNPTGIAVDPSGNLYVSDSNGQTIRKITPGATVTTLAGSGTQSGDIDGSGSTARFSSPAGVAVDSKGNVFVADAANNAIRQITPAGMVTTIGGTGSIASLYGIAGAVTFSYPGGIALDSMGAVYVADTNNSLIRKGILTASPAIPVPITASVTNALPSGPVANGSGSYTVAVTTSATNPTYQWFLNDVAINGATSATYAVAATVPSAGTYTCTVLSGMSSTTVGAGTLAVSTNAWLSNLSARALVQNAPNQLIAGFVTTGTVNKSALVRGNGPVLNSYGVANYLPDPQLTLVNAAGVTQATVTGWNSALQALFSMVGAGPWPAGSKDSAIATSLIPGAYTAQVSSASGANTGVALAEVFDADTSAPANRLINLSVRAQVGTGSTIVIAGFIVTGTTSETVLIRGIGPALTLFGLTSGLPNPVLTLYTFGGAVIATNSGWSNSTNLGPGAGTTGGNPIVIQLATAALTSQVGAFALTPGSANAAMMATLPPGGYTVQLTGENSTTGIGLIELYEVH